jgi:hypothetical protein
MELLTTNYCTKVMETGVNASTSKMPRGKEEAAKRQVVRKTSAKKDQKPGALGRSGRVGKAGLERQAEVLGQQQGSSKNPWKEQQEISRRTHAHPQAG